MTPSVGRLMTYSSVFEQEAAEVPGLVAAQFGRLEAALPPLVDRLDGLSAHLLATVARGSSDNAADFAGYLVGLRLALPTASLPPSLASVYGCTLRLDKALVLAISQSGASPDLCAAVALAKSGGAFALGIVNEPDSPLGHAVDAVIAMGAQSERAVAATKSFILSLTAVAHLVGAWTRDAALVRALNTLPRILAQCSRVDWSVAIGLLEASRDIYVVGRGPSLPIARELALKFKEVCGLHAEALSAAELLHGPIALASSMLPAIVIEGDESSRATVDEAVTRLRAANAPVVVLATARGRSVHDASTVVVPKSPHPLLQPIVTAQAAYPFFASLARVRGRDPDRPPQIEKVTRTL